nr:glycosyltransferase [Euzebyales bacterium]
MTGGAGGVGLLSSPARASAPRAAAVAGNRWTDVAVPALGHWSPERRVTVVVPYHQAPTELARTLAGLSRQSYPRELLQVVVVDDGSQPPLAPPASGGGLRVHVVRQDDRGYGLARARNTGAAVAGGEAVVFLDCDMVPEAWQVESHARWHHVVGDALVVGSRRHVTFDGVGPAALTALPAGAGVDLLVGERPQVVPDHIERNLARTDQLTSRHTDLFRVVSGGNLSVLAETFHRLGGFDETFAQWGAEDTELGFRAFTDGALLVPDRQALCWHQGLPGYVTEAKQRSLQEQRAKIAHLIAHPGFRHCSQGRSYRVPRVVVTVRAGDAGAADLERVVESVLRNRFHDLVVVLDVSEAHPQVVWLRRQLGPDPRVWVGAGIDGDALFPNAPLRMTLTPTCELGPDAVERLVRLVDDPVEGVGAIRVTVP